MEGVETQTETKPAPRRGASNCMGGSSAVVTKQTATDIWNRASTGTPALYKDKKKFLVRLPYREWNRDFLKMSSRKPRWDKKGRYWELPKSWLNSVAYRIVNEFGSAYLLQVVRGKEKCAPACWNAEGPDCECSCKGANHGHGDSDGWFVASGTFAVRHGGRELSCRLLKMREGERTPDIGERVYALWSNANSLIKIGRSTDVPRRLADIQRMGPVSLGIFWSSAGGNDLERALHRTFAERRVHGEWFDFSDFLDEHGRLGTWLSCVSCALNDAVASWEGAP